MAVITSTEMESIVGPQLGVIGGAATGLDIHYKVDGNTDISSSTIPVNVKLSEKSLINAEKKTGVTRTPKPNSQAMSPTSAIAKRQAQSDDKFAGMFSKRGLSPRMGFTPRPDYRAALAAPAVGPLARNQRRLLALRKTFDQIAARQKKAVPLSAESLPQDILKRMVEEAIRRGDKMTPVGSLSHAMKVAGISPKELGGNKNNTQKKRNWALFFNPEMIPSGWAMD
ncbi:MAG: hypothetical protein WC521_07215 [Bdellovibrionales bacterium]|jgi:hypothetical protein